MGMKYIKLSFLLFLFLPALTRAQAFHINIVQDSVLAPFNGELKIKKTPFKIQVTLEGLEGVYLYASFRDTIYQLPDSAAIPGLGDLPAMAEESFNKSKELIISNDGWGYWFYDPQQDWHRFDKDVKVLQGKVTGTKSVKQFYFYDDRKTLQVKDVPGPLYLFFVSAEQGEGYSLKKEIQRYKLKISWN